MGAKNIELSADKTTAFCACVYPNYRQYMSPHNFKITKAFIKSCFGVINYSVSILVFVKQRWGWGFFGIQMNANVNC